jgi:hypothetical protein
MLALMAWFGTDERKYEARRLATGKIPILPTAFKN